MSAMQYTIVKKHVNDVIPGDTVLRDGELYTVTRKNIKHDPFVGTTIFGDSYKSGTQLVDVATMLRG